MENDPETNEQLTLTPMITLINSFNLLRVIFRLDHPIDCDRQAA